jgi:PAS domain S-box-containing protein
MAVNLKTVTKRQLNWTAVIIVTIVIAILSTVYSLTHGITDVYPFIYFLPIILVVYFYPRRGVLSSVGISVIFIMLVYYYSGFNPTLVAVSTAWFVMFITIGVVTSSFAEGLRDEMKKYRGIFENSQAGIFTFHISSRRILEINGKFARMLKYDVDDLKEQDLSRILTEAGECDRFIRRIQTAAQTGEMELLFTNREGAMRQFLVTASVAQNNIVICSAIDITERKLAEQVIAKARDELERRVKERTDELMLANDELKAEIQERKRFEAAIQLANRKLNTLSSITRHDILNQITAIVMYLSIAEEVVNDPVTLEHLKKIEQITKLIQKQIRFTSDYQNVGASTPQWMNVVATIDDVIADLDLKGVRIEYDAGDLEIFADSLFAKVFFNLIDNSLRHGEHVTSIRFSYMENDNELILSCEDDGIGIPENAKERIFKREYYRNTGYGLFLSEEILSITGLSIKETGEPGKGARFEIHVPKGGYRFAKWAEKPPRPSSP